MGGGIGSATAAGSCRDEVYEVKHGQLQPGHAEDRGGPAGEPSLQEVLGDEFAAMGGVCYEEEEMVLADGWCDF